MCKYYPPECDSSPPEGQKERRKRMESPEDCPFLIEAAKLGSEMAVREIFKIIGINVDDPTQVDNFRQDWHFARDQRNDSAKRRDSIANAVIGIVAAGVCLILWVGFAHKINEHIDSITTQQHAIIPKGEAR